MKDIESLKQKLKEANFADFQIKEFLNVLNKHLQATETKEVKEVEMICSNCGHATMPFKVIRPSKPFGSVLIDNL